MENTRPSEEEFAHHTGQAFAHALMGRPKAPALERLAQGLVEVEAAAWGIRDAGAELPPRLGWRAEELARRILDAQRELFPMEDR